MEVGIRPSGQGGISLTPKGFNYPFNYPFKYPFNYPFKYPPTTPDITAAAGGSMTEPVLEVAAISKGRCGHRYPLRALIS
ncbi:hypothetical protein [Mycobacterium botniense]|uniref:Uncharacterized protein n=1 Tax=Mycobacterium botniense TaxID=84962 RepID=A0A7I9Y081_9MYCO|nr:hypothetical protein [Mycobacterium botniense]GFG75449.1 hypothetical protein MBOT_28140 [Mycobacterium botniense]